MQVTSLNRGVGDGLVMLGPAPGGCSGTTTAKRPRARRDRSRTWGAQAQASRAIGSEPASRARPVPRATATGQEDSTSRGSWIFSFPSLPSERWSVPPTSTIPGGRESQIHLRAACDHPSHPRSRLRESDLPFQRSRHAAHRCAREGHQRDPGVGNWSLLASLR